MDDSSPKYIITGTDTDVGKTVFSSALMLGLSAVHPQTSYWKPVQSGFDGGVDTKKVETLTALPDEQFLHEDYVLSEPLSPHRAAELDGVEIDPEALKIPQSAGPLIIEGAGGVLVPLTRKTLFVDVFARWGVPVILCARTGLGTINHTLLSLEALRKRHVPVHGIAFIGDDLADNIRTIAQYSGARVLGRLPWLPDLNARSLRAAFDAHFEISDFV